MLNLSPGSLLLAFTLTATALFGAADSAHAQSGSGTPRDPYVLTAPTKLTKPGYYVLGNNISSSQTSGYILDIEANNVTLDFNGFYVSGPVGNTSQSTRGVYASERSNLTIKNGTVAYCQYGIYLVGNNQANTNAVDALIDGMRITYCYADGIRVQYCPAARIQNCQVTQTGESTGSGVGIYADTSGQTVQNNTISTVGGGQGIGIVNLGGFARQNTIVNAGYGIVYGKYQDNLTLNCGTPFDRGTDAGGNN